MDSECGKIPAGHERLMRVVGFRVIEYLSWLISNTAHAFDDSTGKVVWSFGAPKQIDHMVLSGNKLFVTDFNGGLFALDAGRYPKR